MSMNSWSNTAGAVKSGAGLPTMGLDARVVVSRVVDWRALQ
jgi:hypothetical protein